MEMLNNVSLLLAGDLWQTLIGIFASWITNYGWAIIVFTIALKLVLSPLDIFQRVSSAKQQKVMTVMQPEMAALQQKYGNNKEKLNQETAKLYKKHNVSMGGMCFTMLITMVLTMVIFFTLFSSLRGYGVEKLDSTYSDLRNTHIQAETYVVNHASEFSSDEEKQNYVKQAVLEEYELQSSKNSWLWVKNVWKSDTKTPQFVEYNDYESKYFKDENGNALTYTQNNVEFTFDLEKEFDRYGYITGVIEEVNPGQNGYYVLIILAAVISFLTQWLSAKLLTPKGQKMNMMNKVMFAMIPITMVILALNSNVVFTLYTIVNSIMTALLSVIMSLIINNRNKKLPEQVLAKKGNVEVVEYSRNYRK